VTLRVGDAGDDVPGVGDKLRLFHADIPPGFQANVPAYSLADYERRAPMVWLGIAFALLVIVTGWWRGFLSLVGLVLSAAYDRPRRACGPSHVSRRSSRCARRARALTD